MTLFHQLLNLWLQVTACLKTVRENQSSWKETQADTKFKTDLTWSINK